MAPYKLASKNLPLITVALLFLLIVYSRFQTASHLSSDLGKAAKDEGLVMGGDLDKPRTSDDTSADAAQCPNPPFSLLDGRTSAVMQLASFPGSGNTWVRHLIQRGSGLLTGSVYDDKSLMNEFPAEGVRDSTVIAIKTHFPCEGCWFVGPPERRTPAREGQTGVIRNYKATVQVLRSPFGAILSDFNHKQSGANHTGLASQEAFESTVFDDFVKERIRMWTRHATYYLNEKTNVPDVWLDQKGRPVLLIYYESLKKDTAAQMSKMFAFIKKYSPRDPILAKLDPVFAGKCSIAKDAVGGFKRSGSKNKPYEKAMADGKTVRSYVCDYVRDKGQAFWKKDDPEWNC